MDLKYSLEISKILDKHLPAKGVGTQREVLRMKIHRDFTDLVNTLLIQRVVSSLPTECQENWESNYYCTLSGKCQKCDK